MGVYIVIAVVHTISFSLLGYCIGKMISDNKHKNEKCFNCDVSPNMKNKFDNDELKLK